MRPRCKSFSADVGAGRVVGRGGNLWVGGAPGPTSERLRMSFGALGDVYGALGLSRGAQGAPSQIFPRRQAGQSVWTVSTSGGGLERGGPGLPSLQRASPFGPRPYGSLRNAGAANT